MTHRKKTIGRAIDCDLVLADISVSRLHAEIELLSNNRLLLTDCQSTQGTFVIRDGNLQSVQSQIVTKHDILKFGNIKIPVSEVLIATHLSENDITSEDVKPAKKTRAPKPNQPKINRDDNEDSENRPLSNKQIPNHVNYFINVEDKKECPRPNIPSESNSNRNNLSELASIILVAFLFLTNPNKTDFSLYMDTQINQQVSKDDNDVNSRLLRGLFTGIASKFLMDSAEIHNYYLFSTYTLDLSLLHSLNPKTPQSIKFVGIANSFFPLEINNNADAKAKKS
jgi:pSer/pThr/pTyr-binding forkhead associated (FHA) protein